MKKIMILEDDTTVLNELEKLLILKNYTVESFENPNLALNADINTFDLLLIDVGLPIMDGFSFTKEIRKKSSVPILFLTSRNTSKDEAESILVGGDDYIIKPYNTEVLLLKMNRLLSKKDVVPSFIIKKEVMIDLPKSLLIYQKKEVILTRMELQILYYLFLHENEICSKENIVTYLWNDTYYIDKNALHVNITRIRKKLMEIDLIDFIKTIPKEGYFI